ncbi:hypothetical protein ABT160_43105 [Streptomyces sp. NPDC001941]|uniref:hypothetical protein n=1 Tax=Streptomyces sp. NPDC001941 TaxID=3154659 RepID=UPI0033292CE3
MRKYMRTALVSLVAVAAVGGPVAGAMACEQPSTPSTATDAHQSVKRSYVKTVKLRGGMTAKVYKLAGKGYQADLFLGKVRLHVLTAINKAAVTLNDGTFVKLTPNGTVTSWKYTAKHVNKPSKPGKQQRQICPPGPGDESRDRQRQICPPGPDAEVPLPAGDGSGADAVNAA